VLRDVGQRLGRHEVRRELHRLRQPRPVVDDHRRGQRRPLGQGVQRDVQAVFERRRVDAAGELAQLRQRLGQLRARELTSSSASAGSRRISRWMSESCSASVTSRCWAPSCRLRSMRRRSASAAVTMRSREACSSASRAVTSACSCRFSSATPAATPIASTSSGSSSSDRS
jgi:hypothetical protein